MGRIVEMPLPRLGETMEEGRIGLIVKQPGQAFRRGETLLEVESDKTTVEVPALQDGILVEWLVASDQMVPVETAIARIEIEGDAVVAMAARTPVRTASPPAAAPAVRAPAFTASRPRASTAARAAARKRGIDLAALAGTGRNGRITGADLPAATPPRRATFEVETPHGHFFFRDWPASGTPRGSVLLLHGLFADSQSFTTLGRKLAAAGLRCLAVDLPGHGATRCGAADPAAIAAAVASALPPARWHLVGHSFGALVAVHLAAHLAERADSLTLLTPAGCGEEINGEFIAAMLGGHIGQGLGFLGETVPPEAAAGFADHLSVHAAQLRAIAGAVAEDGRQTVSILHQLSELALPVQAVFQRDDRVIPAHHAFNLPANVAVRFLQGASHLPHWRDPDLIVRLLRQPSAIR